MKLKRINEGGYALRDYGTQGGIDYENIRPTLKELYKIFKKMGIPEKMMAPIGSVGKKDHSGDIDIAMDTGAMAKAFGNGTVKELLVTLGKKLTQKGLPVKANFAASGRVSFAFPIYDKKKAETGGHVQIDIMGGPLEYLIWKHESGFLKGKTDRVPHINKMLLTKYKGQYRQYLLYGIFAATKKWVGDDEYLTYSMRADGIYLAGKTLMGARGKLKHAKTLGAMKIDISNFADFFSEIMGVKLKNEDLATFENGWKACLKSPILKPHMGLIAKIVKKHCDSDNTDGAPVPIPMEVNKYL